MEDRPQQGNDGSHRGDYRVPLLDFSIGNISASSGVGGYYGPDPSTEDSYRTVSSTSTMSTPSNTIRRARQKKQQYSRNGPGETGIVPAKISKEASHPVASKLLDLGRSLKKYLFKSRAAVAAETKSVSGYRDRDSGQERDQGRYQEQEQEQEQAQGRDRDRDHDHDQIQEDERDDLVNRHGTRFPKYDYSVYIPSGVCDGESASWMRLVRLSQVKAWEAAETLSDNLLFERGVDEMEEDDDDDDDEDGEVEFGSQTYGDENEVIEGIEHEEGSAFGNDMNQINEVDEGGDEGNNSYNQSFDSAANDAIIEDENEENQEQEYYGDEFRLAPNQKKPFPRINIYSGDGSNDSQINTPTPLYRSRYGGAHLQLKQETVDPSESNIIKTIPNYTSEETGIVVDVFHNFQGEMGGPISRAAIEEERRAIDARRTSKYIELEKMYLATRSVVAKRRIQVLQKKDIFLKLFGDTNKLNKEYITNNTLYSAFDSHSSAQKAYLEDKEEVNYLLEEDKAHAHAMDELRKKRLLHMIEHPARMTRMWEELEDVTVEELNKLVKHDLSDIYQRTVREYDEAAGIQTAPSSSSAADRSFLHQSVLAMDSSTVAELCFSHLRSCIKAETNDEI